MKIISSKKKLLKLIHNQRDLGFVPTMGGIHKGHISLIKKSIKDCKNTVVSIFVNKPQFNQKSDFNKYPKQKNSDIIKLKKLKINYLYSPSSREIYPLGPNKNIRISSFKKKLCGKKRPGHFEAVVDVIDRFVKIIKHYLNKKYPKIIVVECKTIREKNGLPCSTRNYLLSINEKKIGGKIFNFLRLNKKKIIDKKYSLKKLEKNIYHLGAKKIDYIKLININKILRPYKKKSKYKIFIAYYLGSTRLIDNI